MVTEARSDECLLLLRAAVEPRRTRTCDKCLKYYIVTFYLMCRSSNDITTFSVALILPLSINCLSCDTVQNHFQSSKSFDIHQTDFIQSTTLSNIFDFPFLQNHNQLQLIANWHKSIHLENVRLFFIFCWTSV